jgi:Protein kinase domain/zinc-ribbon domain
MKCPGCGSQLPDGAAFCSACGKPVDFGSTPTVTRVDSPAGRALHTGDEERAGHAAGAAFPPRVGPGARRPPSHTSDFGYEAHYVPGTTLIDRYRIVSPLGKGGMGEVYRAEDLKLGQTVALKFLPKSLAQNAEARARFIREVRLARQVSHPNVCRVFDIGEADGQTFLAMEFVDGEDIASLMRRIGRLPTDKALEIARQVCAGLAAAHEHGIIHRDLKPANIMLDGRGRARITDFGLAGVATDMHGEDARAGTPAYMSPEQFSGGEITVKSDVYSLGLVMYEIFTGKRPYEATTFQEMVQLREKSTPTAPSAHLKDIDPLVERVMMRCLEKNPSNRPGSALQVAAALPGGDPLAAALAAGETPSPEMVAAAGTEGALAPWKAIALLGGIAILMCVCVFLASHAQLINLLPAGKSPEVLKEDSRNILKSIGYDTAAVDSGYWFSVENDYWTYSSALPSPERYRGVASEFPSPYRFDYRQSPQPLETNFPFQVSVDNPATPDPGDSVVNLDEQGRLTLLQITPYLTLAQKSGDSTATAIPDIGPASEALDQNWRTLFTAAGLDIGDFKPVAADWYTRDRMDQQFAWSGVHAGKNVRVRAGALRNRPVFFDVLGAWRRDFAKEYNSKLGAFNFENWINIILASTVFCFTIFLTVRNIRLGRSDVRGAIRGSVVLFVAAAIYNILHTHWSTNPVWQWNCWLLAVGASSGLAVQYAAFYLGIEPYFRRTWPELMISWSRFFAGDVRNALVGRDILTGVFFGTSTAAIFGLARASPFWFSIKSVTPEFTANPGLAAFIADLAGNLVTPFLSSLATLAVLFVLFKMFRRKWIAIIIVGCLCTLFSLQTENPWGLLPLSMVAALLTVICMLRNGLLGLVVAYYTWLILIFQTLTWDFSRWYAPYSTMTLLVVLAIAFYGFSCSLGGRPLFGRALEN